MYISLTTFFKKHREINKTNIEQTMDTSHTSHTHTHYINIIYTLLHSNNTYREILTIDTHIEYIDKTNKSPLLLFLREILTQHMYYILSYTHIGRFKPIGQKQ